MNKEKYNQIIDEAYRKYADSHEYFVDGWLHVIPMFHNKETFVIECKTNPEFSEKWGLKIEERELSLEERLELWYQKNKSETGKRGIWEIDYIEKYEGHKKLNSYNIPTKLITLTYNNETIEVYE